ncbi:acetate/propionate family kinase [Candidatus Nitrospira nitrificans]|uniref:Acetate kinase n=1 Tax=Candidatus Nitrospira nitrificans TaxID=1742973 RepID=A0A0S4LC17_9BACT|nr:acetate/propionate family kinase [Candidatus Nitrospira nitrificans]CUS35061.1 Acetate kinase [Candidatus Nitrospira nitrificans]
MNRQKPSPFILMINGGSSSIKFALFRHMDSPVSVTRGMVDRIGLPNSEMLVTDAATQQSSRRTVHAPDHRTCVGFITEWLDQQVGRGRLYAVGHRIVHGGKTYSRPERVTPELLAELRRLCPYSPEHLPAEIILIESFRRYNARLTQVACFDTAFHRDIPRVARLLPIPRRYEKQGIQRYGFHGLSYTFLMRELKRVGVPGEAEGRVILAHLGNGASMAAVKDGRPIDTTMGFTPASGLPMSRRSGDLDPGLVSYLARTEGMNADEFHKMVNTESGLLGVSELSSDMRDLLEQERSDPRAAEAVALFCYHAKKWIGALTATLGGLDTLVFTAGIGEKSPIIRARICAGLEFLGLSLDPMRNEAGEAVISKEGGKVAVRVMHTDEESEIARSVRELLGEPTR